MGEGESCRSSEFHHSAIPRRLICSENHFERSEIVLSGGLGFAFAAQRGKEIGVARDNARVRDVVSRIRPLITGWSMASDLRAIRGGQSNDVVRAQLDGAFR